MKREIFLSQLVDSMSASFDQLERAMQENDLEKFQKIKEEILKLKKETEKEIEK